VQPVELVGELDEEGVESVRDLRCNGAVAWFHPLAVGERVAQFLKLERAAESSRGGKGGGSIERGHHCGGEARRTHAVLCEASRERPCK
jgi:hypothetical protein